MELGELLKMLLEAVACGVCTPQNSDAHTYTYIHTIAACKDTFVLCLCFFVNLIQIESDLQRIEALKRL